MFIKLSSLPIDLIPNNRHEKQLKKFLTELIEKNGDEVTLSSDEQVDFIQFLLQVYEVDADNQLLASCCSQLPRKLFDIALLLKKENLLNSHLPVILSKRSSYYYVINQALEVVGSSPMFTSHENYCAIIEADSGWADMADAFERLAEADLFDEEYFATVRRYPDYADDYVSGIITLQEEGLLTPENAAFIAGLPSAESYAMIVTILIKAELNIQENINRLKNISDNIGSVSGLLFFIQNAGFLSQEVLAQSIEFAENSSAETLTGLVMGWVMTMHHSESFTSSNFQRLLQHKNILSQQLICESFVRNPGEFQLSRQHFEAVFEICDRHDEEDEIVAVQAVIHYLEQTLPGYNVDDAIDTSAALFNNAESTETASIHESAVKNTNYLLSHFQDKLHAGLLFTVIRDIHDFLMKVKNEAGDELQQRKATAAIDLIKLYFSENHVHGSFREPKTQVSVREKILLFWLAIHDDSLRIGDLDYCKKVFIDCLYEIRCANNINNVENKDNNKAFSFACSNGAFNKCTEKMVSIVRGTTYRYVKLSNASWRLMAMVREQVVYNLRILKQQAITPSANKAYSELHEEVQNNGVTPLLWESIKSNIAGELFDEFKELFPSGIDSEKFQSFLNTGEDVPIPSLPEELKPSLIESPCTAVPFYARASEMHAARANDDRAMPSSDESHNKFQ